MAGDLAASMQCEGWWEQRALGRQEMSELQLQFQGESISGSGHDIVGVFTFLGNLDSRGQLAMVKRYLGQHHVEYIGTYDGEGTLQGEWILPGVDRGPWLIWIKKSRSSQGDEIAEWSPVESA